MYPKILTLNRQNTLKWMLKAPKVKLHFQKDTLPNIAGYICGWTCRDTFTWRVYINYQVDLPVWPVDCVHLCMYAWCCINFLRPCLNKKQISCHSDRLRNFDQNCIKDNPLWLSLYPFQTLEWFSMWAPDCLMV